MGTFLKAMEGPTKIIKESPSDSCVECVDAPAALKCNQCSDLFCELCFQWIHQRGRRAEHTVEMLEGVAGAATDGTTLAFARQAQQAADRQQTAERLAENQIDHRDSISGAESMRALTDRAQYIPIRLSEQERD